jgi:dihydrofolate reductase
MSPSRGAGSAAPPESYQQDLTQMEATMRRVILEMATFWPKSEHPYAVPMNDIAAALAADDLIDEYRLAVQPVALGSGESLFGRLPAAQHLTLVEAKTFPCGVVLHRYTPQHRPATQWASAGDTAKEG